MSARTEEEQGRMLRNCVQKIARAEKRAMDAHGDAMRREFGGETDAQVAADRAAEKRAKEQAAAAAAAADAKRNQDYQLAEQQRADTVNHACTTGEGHLEPTTMIRLERPGSIIAMYLNHQSVLTPVADPQAVANGKCSIQINDGRHSFVGQVNTRDVKVYGWEPPAQSASAARQ